MNFTKYFHIIDIIGVVVDELCPDISKGSDHKGIRSLVISAEVIDITLIGEYGVISNQCYITVLVHFSLLLLLSTSLLESRLDSLQKFWLIVSRA